MDRRSETAGLDRFQSGHLRHFDNLSRRLPNDWSLMKGRSFGQDDFGAYRFQLAYMLYALALTHLHRLPAAPGFFKPVYGRLFEKLLLPEVWTYWHDSSRGGSIFNQHLAHSYKEEWDPVVRDNIMFSAYVQSLSLLFNYLFADDRFAKPGSLRFKFWSYFWGGEPKVFAYDQNSLNEHIYWLMVQSGYVGVACEPNCVFQICNQPAILGFRLHDLLTGGSRAEEVTKGYELAWREFGRLGDDGHYNMMVSEDTKAVRPNVGKSPWVDAWCGALMNMWNRDFVRLHYPSQIRELVVEGADGALSVRVRPRPEVMGERVVTDDCDFGWVAVWASEMGDASTLNGLLRHADRFMNPTWLDRGLYYPRNDQTEDAFGNRTLMEPHTGNTLLGYARLNVPDGLWRLFNEPLDIGFFKNPALIRVAENVDVQRAVFIDDTLHFRLASQDGERGDGNITVGRLVDRSSWVLDCDGHEIACGNGGKVTTSPSDASVAAEADGVSVRCPSLGVHDFEMTFT